MRVFRQSSLATLLLLGLAAPVAHARDSDADAFILECGTSDLPDAAVDSCLERARVLEETNPSARLESLEARLEQRESGYRTFEAAPPGNPPVQSGRSRGMNSSSSDSGQTGLIADAPPRAITNEDNDTANAAPRELPDSELNARGQEAMPESQSQPDQSGETDRPGSHVDPEDEPPIADPPDHASSSDRPVEAPDGPPNEPQ